MSAGFKIAALALLTGNSGPLRRPTLAEAHVLLVDRRLRAFVHGDASVALPPDVAADPALRLVVSPALRQAVIDRLVTLCAERDAEDAVGGAPVP
jgi:hypothetical protein